MAEGAGGTIEVAGVAEGEGATSIAGVARGQSDDGSRKGRVERGK